VALLLSLLALALAAAGEVRCRRDSGAAIAAGIALGFGLVVSYNVTPARAVVPSLWAIVLGAIVGAPLAVILRMILRRVLPGARRA
jgi:ammonia channel protein AmtB